MADALEDHEGSISIGGRTITNLRFADDIDALAGKEEELVKLVNHLDTASTTYGIEISAGKTRLMTLGWVKPFERLKIKKNGEQWLPNHPWCPNSQLD